MTTSPQLTTDDLQAIGEYVVNAATAAVLFGHSSPTTSFVYIDPGESRLARFVRDCFTADQDPSARGRMAEFVDEVRWMERVADKVAM